MLLVANVKLGGTGHTEVDSKLTQQTQEGIHTWEGRKSMKKKE